MCKTFTYFWTKCGHLTPGSMRCAAYPDCSASQHETINLERRCPHCVSYESKSFLSLSRRSTRIGNRERENRKKEVARQISRESLLRFQDFEEAPRSMRQPQNLSSETLADELAHEADGRLRRRVDVLKILRARYARYVVEGYRTRTTLEADRLTRLRENLEAMPRDYAGQPYSVELLLQAPSRDEDEPYQRDTDDFQPNLERLIELAIYHHNHRELRRLVPDVVADQSPQQMQAQVDRAFEILKHIVPETKLRALVKEDRECPICLCEMGIPHGDEEAEEAILLACSHIIGSNCLRLNLAGRFTCPICRYDNVANEKNLPIPGL